MLSAKFVKFVKLPPGILLQNSQIIWLCFKIHFSINEDLIKADAEKHCKKTVSFKLYSHSSENEQSW